jgi:hypothetical protein
MLKPMVTDPLYRTDVAGLVEELRRAHGHAAVEVATQTAKQHWKSAAWKQCALWLQVVNGLTRAEAPATGKLEAAL